MAETILLIMTFIALAIAAYRDIKVREVPDTVSIGLIAIGLLGGLCIAIISRTPMLFITHIYGLLVGALVGTIMYYSRQWGGGDAKLLMGIGAAIGFTTKQPMLLEFIILLVLCGAAYGLCVTLWLALITHRKRFLPVFKETLRSRAVHRSRIGLVLLGTASVIALFFVDTDMRILIGFTLLGAYLLTYLWIFSKAVERGVMVKEYKVAKLTEGDWIAHDVKSGGKIIVRKDTPGITAAEIALLKRRNIRTVMVKEGIAFVPAFLIAFALLIALRYALGDGWALALLP
ncbi:TPA: prepilin peptidase [Candidatus Woesearchaeota archaeon]|nr:prepilin peptidase [Candidatus Woesearchaeota archaeon]